MRTQNEIKEVLHARLRGEFAHDTVDVSDGYQNNIHVIVVSRRFDALTEQQKQEWLWQLIDDAGLEEAEKQLISLALPASPDVLKR